MSPQIFTRLQLRLIRARENSPELRRWMAQPDDVQARDEFVRVWEQTHAALSRLADQYYPREPEPRS